MKKIKITGPGRSEQRFIKATRRLGKVAFVGDSLNLTEHESEQLIMNGLTHYGIWHYNMNNILNYSVWQKSSVSSRLAHNAYMPLKG